jgi:hypothetical protein
VTPLTRVNRTGIEFGPKVDDLDQLGSTNARGIFARSANPGWATYVSINRFPHRAGEALIPRLNIDSSDRGHASPAARRGF